MREINRTVELKTGKTWEVCRIETDAAKIYEALAHDLIAKKINCCTYIKSIKRVCNYDGTQTITVTYDNNCRSIYTVVN